MKHKLIGLYQLITGVFGVILILFKIPEVVGNSAALFSFIVGIALFAGVAYSGYALLNSLGNAVKYSIWAQALQIISFTVSGAKYLFTGSAFLAIVISDGITIKSQLAPIAYSIANVSAAVPVEIKIFVLPVVLLLLLVKK